MTGGPVDPTLMRQTMGRFATGVALITTSHEGEPHGMTVNSLTSVSLDPPLLLVCFTRGARTAEAAVGAGRFMVNILARRQQGIALRFAARGEDHFAGLALAYEGHTVPVVPGALAHLECEVDRVVEAGDHVIIVGAVVEASLRDGDPLAFFGGKFSDVVPHGNEPEHWFF